MLKIQLCVDGRIIADIFEATSSGSTSLKLREDVMPLQAKKDRYCATTVRLPKRVYECAKHAIDTGHTEAESFNDFVVDAVKERLRILREQEIDAAIAEIANDADYQHSAVQMTREFERSDWDAFRTESEIGDRRSEKASVAKASKGRRF
jgi:hypothetical protein